MLVHKKKISIFNLASQQVRIHTTHGRLMADGSSSHFVLSAVLCWGITLANEMSSGVLSSLKCGSRDHRPLGPFVEEGATDGTEAEHAQTRDRMSISPSQKESKTTPLTFIVAVNTNAPNSFTCAWMNHWPNTADALTNVASMRNTRWAATVSTAVMKPPLTKIATEDTWQEPKLTEVMWWHFERQSKQQRTSNKKRHVPEALAFHSGRAESENHSDDTVEEHQEDRSRSHNLLTSFISCKNPSTLTCEHVNARTHCRLLKFSSTKFSLARFPWHARTPELPPCGRGTACWPRRVATNIPGLTVEIPTVGQWDTYSRKKINGWATSWLRSQVDRHSRSQKPSRDASSLACPLRCKVKHRVKYLMRLNTSLFQSRAWARKFWATKPANQPPDQPSTASSCHRFCCPPHPPPNTPHLHATATASTSTSHTDLLQPPPRTSTRPSHPSSQNTPLRPHFHAPRPSSISNNPAPPPPPSLHFVTVIARVCAAPTSNVFFFRVWATVALSWRTEPDDAPVHRCIRNWFAPRPWGFHHGQNDYSYKYDIKSKTTGLHQITDTTVWNLFKKKIQTATRQICNHFVIDGICRTRVF